MISSTPSTCGTATNPFRTLVGMVEKTAPLPLAYPTAPAAVAVERERYLRVTPVVRDHLLSIHITQESFDLVHPSRIRITPSRFSVVWWGEHPAMAREEALGRPLSAGERRMAEDQMLTRMRQFVEEAGAVIDDFEAMPQAWDSHRALGYWARFSLHEPPCWWWELA